MSNFTIARCKICREVKILTIKMICSYCAIRRAHKNEKTS